MESLTICFASNKTKELVTKSLLSDFVLKALDKKQPKPEPESPTLRNGYVPVPALRRLTEDERKRGLIECFNKAVLSGEFVSNKRKKSHIYLICNSHTNAIKIGITNNVDARVKKLQYSSGAEMQILATSESPTLDAFLIERFLHDYYRQYRNIGEWFTLGEYEINQITQLFESINTPINDTTARAVIADS